MTFIDTSAIYSLLDRRDRDHSKAKEQWIKMLKSGIPLFTTNYVVVELCVLVQQRIGLEAIRTIQDDILQAIEVHWLDGSSYALAMTMLLAARRRKLSLVDRSSFLAMRQAGARTAFAFDKHFAQEGFLFPP